MTRTAPEPGTPDLDARYGRTPTSRRRRRWIAFASAAALLVLVAAWAVWAGGANPSPALDLQNTGYQLLGADQVSVRYELTVDPGTAVQCAVQALDVHFEVVGWKVVDIPPSDKRTRAFVDTVRTVSPANTGLIYRCWLP